MIGSSVGLRLTRPKRFPKLKPIKVTVGPFDGMRDSLDPSDAVPNKAVLLENMVPLDATQKSASVGRPGLQQAGAQLGASSKRTGQYVGQWTTLAGTEYTVAIVGGQGIYTFNWTSRAWTQTVTVANLTTASVTLSETAMVYAVPFNNKLVISDGVNKPFTWDGTAGAGGVVSLTNASVFFGQPWVHYAKLTGIKNTARTTRLWSEENDPTLGYDTLPYANTWTLGQTDQNALYAGVGTNSAEYYFRARSAGSIQGAVNSEFVTAGVHDAAASSVGTMSPACLVYHEGRVFFVDAELRPHYVEVGGSGVKAVWNDAIETVAGLDRTYVAQAQGVYHPGVKLVLFALPETSQTIPSMILAINPWTSPPSIAGVYARGFTMQRMGIVKNLNGEPTLMHLGNNDGYAYDHGLPNGTLWSDALNAGTNAIRHVVTTPPMGNSAEYEKQWNKLDILFRAPNNMTSISVRYETPRGGSTAQTFTITSSLSRWDVGVWDTDLWSSASIEQHQAVGINAFGRWIMPTIQHETAGEQFGFEMVQASGVSEGNAPAIP